MIVETLMEEAGRLAGKSKPEEQQDQRIIRGNREEEILVQGFKRYAWLLAVNLYISAFTFGGGYIVVPMIRRFFVEKRQYMTEEDLMDMAAIAQSTPGAIAINLSALAGYKAGGVAGALISCVAAVLPPLVILTCVSAFYSVFVSNVVIAAILKGMEAGVAALMVDLVIDMYALVLKKRSFFLSAMVPLAFIANFVLGINVVLILLVCILQVFYKNHKSGREKEGRVG